MTHRFCRRLLLILLPLLCLTSIPTSASAAETTTSQKCIYWTVKLTTHSPMDAPELGGIDATAYTDAVCAQVDSNGTITDETMEIVSSKSAAEKLGIGDDPSILKFKAKKGDTTVRGVKESDSAARSCKFTNNKTKWTAFTSCLKKQVGDIDTNISQGYTVYALGEVRDETTITDDLNKKLVSEGHNSSVAPDYDPSKHSGGTTGEDTNKPHCTDGAESLGWLLCPLIDKISEVIETIYEKIIEPFLNVKPELFDRNSGTYAAWQTFQGFANIIFVILILVVIISQLTGVGIDNYGIKRILPKLIIAAVLINLSYLICQLAVDISNILGYGLNDLFSNLFPGQISDVTVVHDGTKGEVINGGKLAGAAVTLGVIVAAVAGSISILAAGPSIVATAFIALIGVICAVFVLFILLSIRQAGVVILTVISPIAFVCYMLPNTKPLFDKWLKIFKSLLLLFPLCGLLIGGGNFASAVLLSTQGGDTDFFFALTTMLISSAPFFFVPTLLRHSLSALGDLGNTVSNLGNRFGRNLQGRAQNSDFYKRRQESMNLHRNGLKLDENGRPVLTERGRRMMDRANGQRGLSKYAPINRLTRGSRADRRRRIASAQNAAVKQYGQDTVFSNMPDYFAHATASTDAKVRQDRIKAHQETLSSNSAFTNNEPGEMAAACKAVLDRSDEEEITAVTNVMSKTEEGRAAFRDVIQSRIDAGQLKVGDAEFTAVTAAIRNGGSWKNSDRRTYEWAKQDTSAPGTPAASIESYNYGANTGVDDLTAEYLINANDNAIKQLSEAVQNNSFTPDQLALIRDTAASALADRDNKLRGDRRVIIEKINRDAGGTTT